MQIILAKVGTIFAGFALAFVIKKVCRLRPIHGAWLLKLSLYVTIPCLILVSVSKVGFTRQLIIFPLLPAIVLAGTLVVQFFVMRGLRLERPTEGTFRIAPLCINSAFVLAFLLAVFGGDGATRVVLFNAGYNPLLLIGVYGMAASYNPKSSRRRDVLTRILMLPPFWALITGLGLNVTHATLAQPVQSALQFIGGFTTFLVVAALGILFAPRWPRLNLTLALAGLRIGVGLLIGLGVAWLLRLRGVDRAAVVALAAAPIGFNLLAFASKENLDEQLAADAISLTMILALVVLPVILLVAR
jgi:predicted permease